MRKWSICSAAPRKRLKPSGAKFNRNQRQRGEKAATFRTSYTAFLNRGIFWGLRDVEARVASLVRTPVTHQEHLQVLRYYQGEKYDSHHDFFDPNLFRQDYCMIESLMHGRRNRMATVFFYFNNVEAGGETTFPNFNHSIPRDFKDCTTGLQVKPEKARAIVFYSLHMDGTFNRKSLHGACPVEEGVKWAANKWVWNEPTPYEPIEVVRTAGRLYTGIIDQENKGQDQ